MSELSRVAYGDGTTSGTQTPTSEAANSDLQSFRNGTLRYAAGGRASPRKEWSSQDLRLLRDLTSTGTPVDAIAATLHRTTSAVRNKAGMHGISIRRALA